MRGKAFNLLELHCNQRGVALVISLLILVMVTALGMTGIMTSTSEIKLGGNERIATEALYAADAGIQHALRALRGQDFGVVTAAAQPWLSVNDFNGVPGLNYSVEVSQTNANGDVAPANTVFVTSTAIYPSGERKKIEAEVKNLSTLIPVNSSLNIVGNFSEMELEGDVTINGDLPGGETPVEGSDCASNKAGVAVDTASAYNDVEIEDDAIITGLGLTPSIQLRPQDLTAAAIEALANTIAANADRTIIADEDDELEIGNVTWGTAANPQVTAITMSGEDAEIEFEGDVTGVGILIINSSGNEDGEVEFDGAFNWTGLIIITGDAEFELEIEDDEGTTITGGIVIANTSPNTTDLDFEIEAEENTTIQYSCTALTSALNNSPLSLNAWHEIL